MPGQKIRILSGGCRSYVRGDVVDLDVFGEPEALRLISEGHAEMVVGFFGDTPVRSMAAAPGREPQLSVEFPDLTDEEAVDDKKFSAWLAKARKVLADFHKHVEATSYKRHQAAKAKVKQGAEAKAEAESADEENAKSNKK